MVLEFSIGNRSPAVLIAQPGQFDLGPYTVRLSVRPDNPYWIQYLVFRAGLLIGRHFSKPDLDCCRWLEQQRLRAVYAERSPPRRFHPMRCNYPKRA